MNFDLSEEQQMLQASVGRFIDDHYSLEQRSRLAATREGFSAEHWQTMADLGWLGLLFDEADGGFGGNQVDAMVLMEQFGRGLVLEPYFASIVLGGGTLKQSDNAELKARLLPGVIDGSTRLTLAYAEEQARFDLHDVTTTARLEGDHYVVDGHKSVVGHLGAADHVVVSARTKGGQIGTDGISLLVIPTDRDGLNIEAYPTVDGLRAGELTLTQVRVPATDVVGKPDQGFAILQSVANDAILALCAEAVGAMEVLYKDTVAYTQAREQFGHPLSDFQVLQHRMVDMFMEYEQSKSLLYRATLEAVQNAPTAQRTIHACKHLVGKTGVFIGENAVQLHGGMGMTEELRIGHYFKRLLVIDAQFGNSDYHLHQFAA